MTGDDHTLLIDHQGNLFAWGDNSKGQLGLGHYCEMKHISLVDIPGNEIAKEITAKGNNNVVVTESGKAFYWPLNLSSGEKICKPVEICLPPKIQVVTVACGFDFTVIVSRNGLIFTFGKENQAGQLGHGDQLPREFPTLIESLKNDGAKVTNIACGFKHVICKTALGKVYTWGWGGKRPAWTWKFEK